LLDRPRRSFAPSPAQAVREIARFVNIESGNVKAFLSAEPPASAPELLAPQ
jgi:hypothetical protein